MTYAQAGRTQVGEIEGLRTLFASVFSLDILQSCSSQLKSSKEEANRDNQHQLTQDQTITGRNNNMTGRYLNPQHNNRHNKERSKSFDQQKLHRNRSQSIDKASLWQGALTKELYNNVVVQMVGMDSPNHTVYARVDPDCAATAECLKSVPLGKVIEVMVDEGWRHAVKDIMEKGMHVENETYPSANELLKLGSVWLCNEAAYCTGHNAHARRLSESDEMDTPDWKDMTLRVHYAPERFFVAYEVDWTKYCKGLLLDGCTSAHIGGVKQHVPMTGLPDKKDGVLVYEVSVTSYPPHHFFSL